MLNDIPDSPSHVRDIPPPFEVSSPTLNIIVIFFLHLLLIVNFVVGHVAIDFTLFFLLA